MLLALTAVALALPQPAGVRWAFAAAGLGVGVVAALVSSALSLVEGDPRAGGLLPAGRGLSLILDVTFVSLVVYATGGVRGHFQLLYIPVVLFAGVSTGVLASVGVALVAVVGDTAAVLAAGVDPAHQTGVLALVLPVLPILTWFNANIVAIREGL